MANYTYIPIVREIHQIFPSQCKYTKYTNIGLFGMKIYNLATLAGSLESGELKPTYERGHFQSHYFLRPFIFRCGLLRTKRVSFETKFNLAKPSEGPVQQWQPQRTVHSVGNVLICLQS
jgi:hypothetical protein